MLALKMSPLEICWSAKLLVMRADTVPLPEPGAPIIITRKILWRDITARSFFGVYESQAVYLRHRGENHYWMRNGLDQVPLSYPRSMQRCTTWGWLLQPVDTQLSSVRKHNEEEEVHRRRRRRRRRRRGRCNGVSQSFGGWGAFRAKQSFILQLLLVYVLPLLYNAVM